MGCVIHKTQVSLHRDMANHQVLLGACTKLDYYNPNGGLMGHFHTPHYSSLDITSIQIFLYSFLNSVRPWADISIIDLESIDNRSKKGFNRQDSII